MFNKSNHKIRTTSFSRMFPQINDSIKRREKAGKIKFILNNYANLDFENSICLDIGCSTGAITQELADMFKSIIGIEYDFDALLIGNSINKNTTNKINLINADGMNLPIKNEKIDVIICSQVYEHVPDDFTLAEEMYRVLKPNGVIFFSGPNKSFPFEFHYKLLFIHWLPIKMENYILRKIGNGNKLYERIKRKKELLEVFKGFYIQDLSIEVVQYYAKNNNFMRALLIIFPIAILRKFSCWVPNFNWLIRKNSAAYLS